MNIGYQSSNEFAIHTGISLYSLLYNNKDISELNIYLLSNGIHENELNKLNRMVESFHRHLYIIDNKFNLDKIQEKYSLKEFSNINACSEILPTDVFPEYIDEILLIDSDTIINRSLKDIRPDCFDNYLISAVPNFEFNYLYENLDKDSRKVIDKNGIYFNSGVVLYNLKKWREMKCENLIIEAIQEIQDRQYFASQTILNLAIPPKLVYNMSYTYNYFGFLYGRWDRKNIHRKYNENVKEIENNPVVLHYKGSLSRPWYKELHSKEISIYRFYKSLTEWRNYPLESIFEASFFKNLSSFEKLKLFIIIKFKKNLLLDSLLYLKSRRGKII